MGQGWVSLGAIYAALGVGAAAFGAHALESRLDAKSLELWEMAGRYLIYGGLFLCVIGVVAYQRVSHGVANAGLILAVGTLIFCGTLFGLALGGPRWLGAVTPVGGSLLILGLLWFAWSVFRT